MVFRRRTYQIKPEMLSIFNSFFQEYLYPNQKRFGAKLVGRWVNETKDEITAIWEYQSMEHYHQIEDNIRKTELHQKSKQKRKELGNLYVESRQDFLESTVPTHPPKHIVAVSGYITNKSGEVLLVRNEHRADTLEIPGGQLEEGETVIEGAYREIWEETGVKVKLDGITGVYQNLSRGIISIVLKGEYVEGELSPAKGETSEVVFKKLTPENIDQYITRPHFQSRTLDAMEAINYIPYEAFDVRPYQKLSRLNQYGGDNHS
ncbi:NUDIX domain-containing protein [Gracilibacillus sp. D59]|uniref:NUDIX domain-containing protein n=1 Tax=Gracilibacillus sp. D59 TaxID=3457434 RepID=UPI003FCE317E